jgi:CheY-like chemotaxis protein/nitrogen-specific signal transduction histidine kinase
VTDPDITERRRLEDRLHRVQKLETIGQLTGGIVHDFNNLLTSLLGNLELLRTRLGTSDPASPRLLSVALKAAEHGARLTTQLLAVSRQQPAAPEAIDLNRLINGMDALLRSAVGAANRIETAPADPLSLVLADPTQIELVVLNLAINARDAMPSGGTITIRTANVELAGPPGWPEAPPPGEYVMCSVTDTGKGIPKEILDKVFHPFFTTKEAGKGSGLGFSQVLGVVKQLGGGVRIETRPGGGTTVSLYLPRADVKPAAGRHEPEPRADRGTDGLRRAVILVIDDDSDVRAAAAEMLRYAGHDVVEAASGREALECLGRENARVDLMIVDFVMPEMNGVETARLARLERPSLPVMFMSGFANSAVLAAQTDADHVLQKPFRPSDVAVKVERVLRSALGRLGRDRTRTADWSGSGSVVP